MKTRTLAVLVALASTAAVLPIPAVVVERWYSTLAYPRLQRVLTPTSNLVPFALFDVLWVAAVAAAALLVYRRVRDRGWTRGLPSAAGALVAAAAVTYLAFLGLWGLNYRRVPLTEKLVFDRRRISEQTARDLGAANAAALNRLYAAAHPATFSERALAASFERTIAALGGGVPIITGRPKQTLLGGYFHQISVSGMTDPFFLETLVAPDLFDVERPFVVAHEWAHLAGYADESEANFIAWLTCRHGEPVAQYSAALEMIGYAAPGRPLGALLDIGPRIDLTAIAYRYAHTSRVLRVAARQGYDTYLKANRVERGVESYDAVVQLILGTVLDDSGYPRRP
ncbi:MAG TPA: DUF3810 family protein [Vicinamibacterales bacterium]